MTIQLIDIKRNGFATYLADGRLYKHHMQVSTSMIREANEGFKGSLGDAKFDTHIEPTIAKFHPLKTRSL